MNEQTRAESWVLAAAERQMQAWTLTQEIAERAIRVDAGQQVAKPLGNYLTISREAGADGGQIAERVGAELGWEVLDQCLLDRVAERYRLSREMLELVDETESNWAFDVLGQWLDRKIVPHEKYVVHLGRVILAAARRGNVVFVGRGAQFLLPQGGGLAVRVIAAEKYRVESLMRRHGVDAAEARRMIRELDAGRRDFVRKSFHRDVDDPRLYDLVLAVDRLGPEAAAALIVAACRGQ